MDKVYLLGLDVGTSGCKAVVFDNSGNTYGYAYTEYEIICDAPSKAEQDAMSVLHKLLEVTGQAIQQSGIRKIEALSVSVQGDATILVDNDFKPLHNALLGMDYRNTDECAFFESVISSKDAFLRTGMRIHPINSLGKILWYKNHVPDVFAKSHRAMTYSDFILAHLGGEPVIDLTMASRTMAMNIHTLQWDEQILNNCGIDKDILSLVKPSGTPCGRLSDKIRIQWGLDNAPLLVVGGHDQTCGAIGAGMVDEGIGVDSSGTAEVFSSAFRTLHLDDAMFQAYYPCYCHAVDGLYFTFALNHTGGIILRWFRDNLAKGDAKKADELNTDFYNYIQREISNRPSSVLVLPHFSGSGTPVCDMESKGAFIGLTLSTSTKEIFKALIDGLTYELKMNVDTMNTVGVSIQEVRAVGGGAKSSLWLQTKADILNMPIVTLKCKEAGCLGSAALAAVGAGIFEDISAAVDSMVHKESTWEPNQNITGCYAEKYEIYKTIYPSLMKINKKL